MLPTTYYSYCVMVPSPYIMHLGEGSGIVLASKPLFSSEH